MLFSSTCWQRNFITVTSYFLRWSVSHALFIYRCVVFPLVHNSGYSGASGNDGLYSSNMGSWGWGHFCCYSLLLDFVHLHVGPGIFQLYARTTLLHHFALWARVFIILSRTLFLPSRHKHGIRVFVFFFEFFIAQKSSIVFGRGESEWMTYGLDYAMDSPIFALSLLWCSTCFTVSVWYT